MSEEKVTYVELKLPKSKKQNDKKHPGHTRREYPWHIIAIILGILCLFLLLATTYLGYKLWIEVNQCPQQYEKGKDPGGNCTYLPEVHNNSNVPVHPEKDCDRDQEQWSCSGKSCYLFLTEEKTWDESKTSCEHIGFNLIKIDDEEEQKFIQSKIKYTYWVGLHKKGANDPWLWQDGSKPSTKLNFQMSSSTSEVMCGRFKNTQIVTDDCTKVYYYICEKTRTCMYK